jgi:hypothetical protein
MSQLPGAYNARINPRRANSIQSSTQGSIMKAILLRRRVE